jgi:hypothetical protein
LHKRAPAGGAAPLCAGSGAKIFFHRERFFDSAKPARDNGMR